MFACAVPEPNTLEIGNIDFLNTLHVSSLMRLDSVLASSVLARSEAVQP